jgi:hypothetical protein
MVGKPKRAPPPKPQLKRPVGGIVKPVPKRPIVNEVLNNRKARRTAAAKERGKKI